MFQERPMIEDITLKNCIEFAVGTEDNGIKFYKRLSENFSDNPEISNLFESLSQDEAVHRRQFSELLNHLPQEAGVSGAPEKSDYIKAMSISEFFSHRHGPFVDVDKIEDGDDALERAFNLEKDTLGFYQAVQDVLGENSVFTQVIEAEKSHVTRLMKAIIAGEKFRSLQDKWS